MFAWKPAPIQVSWLGYLASTGVPGMDYLLADPISLPDTNRKHFTEVIWHLPETANCLTPPTSNPRLPITPTPALRNGYITFGCFQNLSKINDTVLAVWARILRAMPTARLRLQIKQLTTENERIHLFQRVANAGIAPENVHIAGVIPGREAYLATHAEVDIILDTFPCPGITTTCEALWMGVPTLTLAGNTLLSRQGASLLSCVGLTDWIANDVNDYVARAIMHAGNISELAQLRAGLRERALSSPLFDAPRFANNLREAFLGMWQLRMANNSDTSID